MSTNQAPSLSEIFSVISDIMTTIWNMPIDSLFRLFCIIAGAIYIGYLLYSSNKSVEESVNKSPWFTQFIVSIASPLIHIILFFVAMNYWLKILTYLFK